MTDWEVYVAFRAAQGNSKGRPFRLPKDWESFKSTRMKPKNVEQIVKAAGWFSTKWRNVDLDRYMEYGFDLWKGFSYHQFFNKKLIEYYIQKDRILKRKLRIDKGEVVKSLTFIKKFMVDKPLKNGYNSLQTYCRMKDGQKSVLSTHYVKGKIDNITMTYLIYKKYYLPTNYERKELFTHIINRYRDYISEMEDIKPFIIKAEKTL